MKLEALCEVVDVAVEPVVVAPGVVTDPDTVVSAAFSWPAANSPAATMPPVKMRAIFFDDDDDFIVTFPLVTPET